MNAKRGFTIVEVLVAIVVLTVGLLGLVTTAALTTRMIARGQRSSMAATFAAQRMERLRVSGCTNQVAGADTLYRGSTWVAVNTWTFANVATSTWRIVLVSTYKTQLNKTKIETMETSISCLV
ncbi:MAG TPA: prepilin-type N-terminal cleavage/methylation domain-containing protein [Gemmatimonadales bacterium]|nr:prepilin-type N-terminal cleavage/methylation domain-containing protein [Gemmatimonadales bacterium]